MAGQLKVSPTQITWAKWSCWQVLWSLSSIWHSWQTHILYHCISMLIFLCSVSYPLETLSLYSIQHSWGLHPLDWVYLLTHFLGTIRLRRYHKILKCILLRIFWILTPYSMKNFWSLNKTCVWVPFCLLLNAFLLLGLCRLCYIEHVVESISGTV